MIWQQGLKQPWVRALLILFVLTTPIFFVITHPRKVNKEFGIGKKTVTSYSSRFGNVFSLDYLSSTKDFASYLTYLIDTILIQYYSEFVLILNYSY